MSAEFLTSEEEGVVGMAAGASGFEAVVNFATTSDEEEPKPSQVKTTVDVKNKPATQEAGNVLPSASKQQKTSVQAPNDGVLVTSSDEEEPKPSKAKTTRAAKKKNRRHRKQTMCFQVPLRSKKPRHKHPMMACSQTIVERLHSHGGLCNTNSLNKSCNFCEPHHHFGLGQFVLALVLKRFRWSR
jgi:hypothetical protein